MACNFLFAESFGANLVFYDVVGWKLESMIELTGLPLLKMLLGVTIVKGDNIVGHYSHHLFYHRHQLVDSCLLFGLQIKERNSKAQSMILGLVVSLAFRHKEWRNEASQRIAKQEPWSILIAKSFEIHLIKHVDVLSYFLHAFKPSFGSFTLAEASLVDSTELNASCGEHLSKVGVIAYIRAISMHVEYNSLSLRWINRLPKVCNFKAIVSYKVNGVFFGPLKLLVINELIPVLPFFESDLVTLFVLNILALHISCNWPQYNALSSVASKISHSHFSSFSLTEGVVKLIIMALIGGCNHLLKCLWQSYRIKWLNIVVRCLPRVATAPVLVIFLTLFDRHLIQFCFNTLCFRRISYVLSIIFFSVLLFVQKVIELLSLFRWVVLHHSFFCKNVTAGNIKHLCGGPQIEGENHFCG